jgi:adenine-specific DNA-methyltransferase
VIFYIWIPRKRTAIWANYHLLNTIAEYKPFIPDGKTGLRKYVRSDWCSRRFVSTAFDSLIKEAQFKYIFLSYNNEGLMSVDNIRRIMSKYGQYSLFETDHQRFKADKDENRNHYASSTKEYLHVLEKKG